MLRTLLVGILAMTAAAACSSKDDAPAAQPGVSAGKVVELTGTVTATRGDQVRSLATGGEISADDVIDTAADSRVVILVAHNNARWDLGPNKHGKVAESLAWTAPKQDRPAAAVIEESSTAGAHAEKAAATTGNTTEAPRAAMTEPAADRAVNKADASPPAAAELATKPLPPAGAVAPEPPPAYRAPPPPPRAEGSRPRPTTVSPPPANIRGNPRKMSEEEALPMGGKKEDSVYGAAPGAAIDSADVGDGGRGSAGDPVRQQILQGIREQFAKGRTKMRACFEPSVANVRIKLAVTNGVYSITIVDPATTPKARACLTAIAKSLGTTTKHDQPVSVTLTLEKP